MAAGDIDGDGDLDLCVTAVGERGATAGFVNDGSGRFSSGPSMATEGVSPSFGDVDNDVDLDLWLGRAGGDLLLDNAGKGHFSRAAVTLPANEERLTTSARRLDVDSDGDLDLLASRLKNGSAPGPAAAAPRGTSGFGCTRARPCAAGAAPPAWPARRSG